MRARPKATAEARDVDVLRSSSASRCCSRRLSFPGRGRGRRDPILLRNRIFPFPSSLSSCLCCALFRPSLASVKTKLVVCMPLRVWTFGAPLHGKFELDVPLSGCGMTPPSRLFLVCWCVGVLSWCHPVVSQRGYTQVAGRGGTGSLRHGGGQRAPVRRLQWQQEQAGRRRPFRVAMHPVPVPDIRSGLWSRQPGAMEVVRSRRVRQQ